MDFGISYYPRKGSEAWYCASLFPSLCLRSPSSRAGAETTDCTTPVLIITDGRITQSTFPAMTPGNATTFWFGIYAQAGHSYSVEFVPQADNYSNTTRVQFTTLGVFGPGDTLQACHGTSSVTVTQNSGYAPVILKNGNGAGRRVSFTARSAGLHLISLLPTWWVLGATLFGPWIPRSSTRVGAPGVGMMTNGGL